MEKLMIKNPKAREQYYADMLAFCARDIYQLAYTMDKDIVDIATDLLNLVKSEEQNTLPRYLKK